MNINPTYRMIAVCAAVLIPVTLLMAYTTIPPITLTAVILVLLLGLMVDALRTLGALDAIRIGIPDPVRATKGLEVAVEVTIEIDETTHRLFLFRLHTPDIVHDAQDSLLVAMPADTKQATFAWKCTPIERGNIPIREAVLGATSPWGFWDHRRILPVQGTIRSYPNLQQDRKSVARVFLNRSQMGIHRQRHVGRGRDFAQLREYIPGDSYEDIHWKATARTGAPVTKLYQIERSQEVYIVIDSSRQSATRMERGGTTNLERCINAALVLGLVAEQQGDQFGLITFDSQVRTFLKARNGRGHFNACRDALYGTQSAEQHADFAELFSFIRLNLRKRALLVILTNLNDPLQAEQFSDNVDIIARNHLVFVNVIADTDVQPIFSGDSPASLDEIYTRMGGHLEWNNMQALRHRLRLRNITMQHIRHDALSADLVCQFMSQRHRQLL